MTTKTEAQALRDELMGWRQVLEAIGELNAGLGEVSTTLLDAATEAVSLALLPPKQQAKAQGRVLTHVNVGLRQVMSLGQPLDLLLGHVQAQVNALAKQVGELGAGQ